MLRLAISKLLSSVFEQSCVFAEGRTLVKLEVFDTYVYRLGIQYMDYSFSTALGIFKSIVSIVLLTAANWSSKTLRGEAIF